MTRWLDLSLFQGNKILNIIGDTERNVAHQEDENRVRKLFFQKVVINQIEIMGYRLTNNASLPP